MNETNTTMRLKANYKKGQTVTYTKTIMFKGDEQVTAKIVAIFTRSLMLDNGDELYIF